MSFFLKVRDYLFFHSAAAGLLDRVSDENSLPQNTAGLWAKSLI